MTLIPCWYCYRPMEPPGGRYCDVCQAQIMSAYRRVRRAESPPEEGGHE